MVGSSASAASLRAAGRSPGGKSCVQVAPSNSQLSLLTLPRLSVPPKRITLPRTRSNASEWPFSGGGLVAGESTVQLRAPGSHSQVSPWGMPNRTPVPP